MTQPYPITDTPCTYYINGFKHTGRVWRAHPLEITDSDISAEAIAYRARNPVTKFVNVNVLLGVRYATADRFKPAVMFSPGAAADCSKWGPIAPQSFDREGGTPALKDEWGSESSYNYASFGTREGEDCLFANWYLPTGSAPVGGWPVLVWFHGGGANFLSASNYDLRAHRAAAEGFAVMTLEYRLGTLGSWWHPDMEAEPDFVGVNFMKTDAVAALEWVQAHGADLGIDITKVGFGGSSFGGEMTINLMQDAYASTLFTRAYSSSPGRGVQRRFEKQWTDYLEGYEAWHGTRHRALEAAATSIRDAADPSRTFADAIADKGFLAAVRENLSLYDFLAMDGGKLPLTSRVGQWQPLTYYARGDVVEEDDELYEATVNHTSSADFETDFEAEKMVVLDRLDLTQSRSLTMMRDNLSISYSTNRDAARDAAILPIPLMIGVAQQESSLISFGARDYDSYPYDRDLVYLGNYTRAEWKNPATGIVHTEYNGGPSAEPWSEWDQRRMIFNFCFYHPAREVAKAVTLAGGTAWLQFGNYTPTNRRRKLCGHTWDVAFLMGNPHYALTPREGKPTAADIRVSDGMVKAMRNFLYNGDPNIEASSSTTLDLFATPWGQTFEPYNVTDENWNVVGSSPWRSSTLCTPDITTYDHFWDHVFTDIEGRI